MAVNKLPDLDTRVLRKVPVPDPEQLKKIVPKIATKIEIEGSEYAKIVSQIEFLKKEVESLNKTVRILEEKTNFLKPY